MTRRTLLEIAAALLAAGLLWYYATPAPVPVNQWTAARAAPEVKSVPTQALECKPVTVYAPDAKSKLDLPTAVQADPNQFVLGTAKLGSSLRPETLTTVYDDQTGKSVVLVKSDPYPWLAAEQTGEARLDYGYKYSHFESLRILRLSMREDLLQVKAFHAGLNSSLDSDGQFFIGAGVGYRW